MSKIKVEVLIDSGIEQVWNNWTSPSDITKWYFASNDWHAPHADNDLRIGGKFNIRMEAKDGSVGFDFSGSYTDVIPNELIEYDIDDGRNVVTEFESTDKGVSVTQTFDAERINSEDLQRKGWQAILDNFKKYVES